MFLGILKHQRHQPELKFYSYTKTLYIPMWACTTKWYGAINSFNLVFDFVAASGLNKIVPVYIS